MLKLEVSFDFSKAIEMLTDIEQKQIPFATSVALNTTAFDAQSQTRRGLSRRFILRNNFVERGILVVRSTKTQLWAKVYSRDYFMALQETGGTKTPSSGTRIALPATVRKNVRGLIPKSQRPPALRGQRTFRATIHGREGLFKRVRKGKRLPITMLYAFKPSVQIRPRFGLEETVRGVVKSNWSNNFAFAFAKALATARR